MAFVLFCSFSLTLILLPPHAQLRKRLAELEKQHTKALMPSDSLVQITFHESLEFVSLCHSSSPISHE